MYKSLTEGNKPYAFEYHKVQYSQQFPQGEAQNPVLNTYVNKPENSVNHDVNLPALRNQDTRENPGEPVMKHSFEQDPNKLFKPKVEAKGTYKPVHIQSDFFQDPSKVLYKK